MEMLSISGTPSVEGLSNEKGFTLIELLIVLIVLGILATLALPAYKEYLQESRRSDATITLHSMMSQQALYYGNSGGTYTRNVTMLGYTQFHEINQTLSKNNHYAIAILACDEETSISECVAIEAVVQSASQLLDHPCHRFSLNSRGARSATRFFPGHGELSSPEIIETCWK